MAKGPRTTNTLLILLPLVILLGCSNPDAEVDLAACESRFPPGAFFQFDNDKVIDCMKEKGWQTNFMVGSGWWQSKKSARASGTYSK